MQSPRVIVPGEVEKLLRDKLQPYLVTGSEDFGRGSRQPLSWICLWIGRCGEEIRAAALTVEYFVNDFYRQLLHGEDL